MLWGARGGMATRGRLGALDSLRGLAALAVVAFHYLGRYNGLYGDRDPVVSNLHLEVYGVSLFFIISGFVIFMTVERSARLRDFALSRFVRLFPLYWACVVLTWVVVHLAGPDDRATSIGTMLVNLTMVQSWFGVENVDGVYWTLAVELSFYLLAALALACGATRGRRLGVAIGLWILVTLALRSPFLVALPGHEIAVERLDVRYSHLFIAGICFYLGWRHGHTRWTRIGLLYGVVITTALDGLREGLIVLLLFAIFHAALAGWLPPLAWRPLQWIGLCSYALYLVHQNIGYAALTHLETGGVAYWPAVTAVALGVIGLASALTFGWERPVARLIKARAKVPDQFRRDRDRVPSTGT
jgi:peptidoglycan/LPS O-acetylase OafA/YrhL